jgi:hypothetical protein
MEKNGADIMKILVESVVDSSVLEFEIFFGWKFNNKKTQQAFTSLDVFFQLALSALCNAARDPGRRIRRQFLKRS